MRQAPTIVCFIEIMRRKPPASVGGGKRLSFLVTVAVRLVWMSAVAVADALHRSSTGGDVETI